MSKIGAQFNKVMSKMGVKVEEELGAESKAQDERCIPLAYEILQLLAESRPALAVTSHKVAQDSYQPIVKKLLTIFLERDIIISDIDYVFRLMHEAIKHTQSLTTQSLDISMKKGETAIWGKEIEKLTVGDLDYIIKQNAIQ